MRDGLQRIINRTEYLTKPRGKQKRQIQIGIHEWQPTSQHGECQYHNADDQQPFLLIRTIITYKLQCLLYTELWLIRLIHSLLHLPYQLLYFVKYQTYL